MKKALVYLAKTWYKVLDSNGFLFSTLKEFKIQIRILFYLLATVFIYLGLSYVGTLVDLDTYKTINNDLKVLIGYMGYFILYLATLLTASLSLYEFIYDTDMININKKRKKRRFGNINYKIRIFIYLIVFMILFQYVYFGFLFSIGETSESATFSNNGLVLEFASTLEEREFVIFFENMLTKVIASTVFIYLIIISLMEFRIKRQKRVCIAD